MTLLAFKTYMGTYYCSCYICKTKLHLVYKMFDFCSSFINSYFKYTLLLIYLHRITGFPNVNAILISLKYLYLILNNVYLNITIL